MTEPKKNTVRIAFPLPPVPASPAVGEAKGDTSRIVLPSRTPVRNELPPAPFATPGPKQETVRISILPRPGALPVAPDNTSISVPPVALTSKPLAPVEAIPRPLSWALFALSAAIFLIQIWNYVVS